MIVQALRLLIVPTLATRLATIWFSKEHDFVNWLNLHVPISVPYILPIINRKKLNCWIEDNKSEKIAEKCKCVRQSASISELVVSVVA